MSAALAVVLRAALAAWAAVMADANVKARLVVVLVATEIAATTAADVSAAAIVIVAIAQVAAMAIEIAPAEALDSAARWGRVAAQETHAVRAALESVQEDAAGRNELKPWLAICGATTCSINRHSTRSPCWLALL